MCFLMCSLVQDTHGFDAASVGWATLVFGGGELSGTLLASWLADGIGLQRGVVLGAAAVALACVDYRFQSFTQSKAKLHGILIILVRVLS